MRLSTEAELDCDGVTIYDADDVDVAPFKTSKVCKSSAEVVTGGGEVNCEKLEGRGGEAEENPFPLEVEKSQPPEAEA